MWKQRGKGDDHTSFLTIWKFNNFVHFWSNSTICHHRDENPNYLPWGSIKWGTCGSCPACPCSRQVLLICWWKISMAQDCRARVQFAVKSCWSSEIKWIRGNLGGLLKGINFMLGGQRVKEESMYFTSMPELRLLPDISFLVSSALNTRHKGVWHFQEARVWKCVLKLICIPHKNKLQRNIWITWYLN